jgi:hypothetical protein
MGKAEKRVVFLAVVLLRFPSDSGGADRWGTHALFSLPNFLPITANCIKIDHFSAFESELVALFSRCRLKTAGDGSKRPEI